jgi:hypothetical protein
MEWSDYSLIFKVTSVQAFITQRQFAGWRFQSPMVARDR